MYTEKLVLNGFEDDFGDGEALVERVASSPKAAHGPRLLLLDPMCSPIGSPVGTPRSIAASLRRSTSFKESMTDADVVACLSDFPPLAEPLHKEPEATLWSSWCVLTNTLLGVGILTIPSAIAHMGLLLGTSALAIAGLAAALSLHLLSVLAMRAVDGQGPADITFYAVCISVAPGARWIVDAAIAVKCFGVATSYLQVVGQLCAAFVQDLVGSAVNLDLVRQFSISAVVVVVIAPSVFHKRITKTVFQNMLAIGAWLYITILLLALLFGTCTIPEFSRSGWQWYPPADLNFCSFASSLPVFIFSFTCHQNLFSIASELKGRSVRSLDIISSGVMSAGFAIYLCAGVAAYLTFGVDCETNILLNLPSNKWVLFGRALVIVAVVFTYPLQLHPCRRSLMIMTDAARGTFADRGEQRLQRRVFTVSILVLTLWLAMKVNNLGLTLAFVGAVGSNTVVLIMPAFLYIKSYWKKGGPTWYLAVVLFATGCMILPASLFAIIWKLANPSAA